MWRVCGTQTEPRVLNTETGMIWEVYPTNIKELLNNPNSSYWKFRGYKGEPITIQYGPPGPPLDDIHIDITKNATSPVNTVIIFADLPPAKNTGKSKVVIFIRGRCPSRIA